MRPPWRQRVILAALEEGTTRGALALVATLALIWWDPEGMEEHVLAVQEMYGWLL